MRNYNVTQRMLVTGGAGCLGSHLCDRLLADGHDVLCLDNFFTGTKANVDHLLDHPRVELMRHDVTFPLYVEVDQIYNLACPASPVHCQRDPVQTMKTSVHGAINMLGLAKRLRARIFRASTSEEATLPADDPMQRKPDIALARSKLDWEPVVPLREGYRVLRSTSKQAKGRLICGIAGVRSFGGFAPTVDWRENLAIRRHLAASGSNAVVKAAVGSLPTNFREACRPFVRSVNLVSQPPTARLIPGAERRARWLPCCGQQRRAAACWQFGHTAQLPEAVGAGTLSQSLYVQSVGIGMPIWKMIKGRRAQWTAKLVRPILKRYTDHWAGWPIPNDGCSRTHAANAQDETTFRVEVCSRVRHHTDSK